jgi:AraC family transcriptional regulator
MYYFYFNEYYLGHRGNRMRLNLIALGLAIALALPQLAPADCCCCCAEEEQMEMQVSKATAPALPVFEEMQSFDGSVAPTVVELQPTRFAVVKGTLADPAAVWQKAPGLAAAQGLLGESTRAWSIIPEMPQSAESMDPNTPYWGGFTLAEGARPSGELEEYTTPGGKYVMGAHRGPYEGLGDTWGKFAAFVFHNANVDMARPALEFYYSDPGNTKPEDLITLLYIPLN